MAESIIDQVRAHFPVLGEWIYMNNGTEGPLSDVVEQAMRTTLQRQFEQPRIGADYMAKIQEVKEAARKRIAALLHCRDSELALTHNTTEGMNFITLGVNWVQGDEAITTNVEHPGALLPLWVVKERYGVTVKTADVGSAPDHAAETVLRHITPRTKLISLSHVSYSTGDVLPIADIAAEAHRHGVLVLVDGAQSFAAMALDMASVGADFYAVPGQKWLCGPEGTGALYSRQEAISQIRTTFASYGTMDGFNDYGGFLVKEDGRRFEQGTMQLADLEGQVAACQFLSDVVGPEWAFSRISELTGRAIDALAGIPGVRVVTNRGSHAGLVTFAVGAVEPDDVVAELAARRILVRTINHPRAVRLSIGYYTTEDEIDQVVAAIAELATAGGAPKRVA